jgi:hypothetical protein
VTRLTEEQVLDLLRTGTPEARIDFLRNLPPNGFKDSAASLMGSDNPGVVIVALVPLIHQFCYGSNPECGVVLAAAAHERAVEVCETVQNHGLIATTLSGLALSHVKGLTLLGRSEQVLEATQHYVQLYERLAEHQNLSSLKVLRIEALINLQRIDEAGAELQDEALFGHPTAGIEANRLKGWIDLYRTDPTKLRSEAMLLNPLAQKVCLGF